MEDSYTLVCGGWYVAEVWEHMSEGKSRTKVMIASPLEEELARRIGGQPGVELLYEPGLLPEPRFASDHRGKEGFVRSAAQERAWAQMLGEAEVLFGVPGDSPAVLKQAVDFSQSLRWIQATSAGAGEQVRGAGLSEDQLCRVKITTASGVHAVPLAEFAIFGLLALAKGLPRLLEDKRERRWPHYPTGELFGKTLLVVGLGNIGVEVARLAGAFGMYTVATKRNPRDVSPAERGVVDELHPPERLGKLLPAADAVVVTLPQTEETRGVIDRQAIASLKPDSIFVNVGRGAVVDEEALADALEQGRIRGACLDVFDTEPLPENSRLWSLDNVIVSPHTAALSEQENARIVDLFCRNIERYRRGERLENEVDTTLFY